MFAGIATIPKTKTDFHWGLRELVTSLSCVEGAYNFAIDRPDNLGGRPVNRVVMESSLGRCNADVFGDTIVQDTFAKVISLGLSSVGTSKLPIDLVHVIGEQNHAADYAFTWSNLGDILNMSEKEEEVRIDGWRITLFPEVEHGAHGRVEGCIFVESAGPVAGKSLLLREIHEVRAGRETQSVGAGDYKNR